MSKKYLITYIIFSLSLLQSHAQVINDTCEIKKTLGNAFKVKDTYVSPKQMLFLMKDNPEAFKEMQQAKKNYYPATILGLTGGILVGWPLVRVAAGGASRWPMAGVGCCFIASSIYFNAVYMKHAKRAVNMYNNGLKNAGTSQINYQFGLTANGLMLRICF